MRIIKQCGTNEVKPRKRSKEIKNAAKGVQAVGRGCAENRNEERQQVCVGPKGEVDRTGSV